MNSHSRIEEAMETVDSRHMDSHPETGETVDSHSGKQWTGETVDSHSYEATPMKQLGQSLRATLRVLQ